MTKPGSQPHDQSSLTSTISHFSHPHPLQLSHTGPGFINPYHHLCSGCKHEASGAIYTCHICNYSLHPKCSEMPQQITHPFDGNNHALYLLLKPAYPEGLFNCDACGERGNGFSYHCQACGIDLHILCASSPMVFSHQSHHHQLNLIFSPPYPFGTFSCDICKRVGSKTWLYRCSVCEFDAHLSCVNALPSNLQPSATNQFAPVMPRSASVPTSHTYTTSMAYDFDNRGMNPVGYNPINPTGIFPPFQPETVSRVAVATPYGAPVHHSFMHSGSFGSPVMMPGEYRQENTMTTQIVEGVANGLASGAAQAAAGALIQGIFGGGNS